MLRSLLLLLALVAAATLAACGHSGDPIAPDAASTPSDDAQIADAAELYDAPPASVASVVLAGGWAHTCGISGSTVKCWGQNAYGELGIGNMQEMHVPQSVAGVTGIVAIAAANVHSCALDGAGAVWCWGRNNNGELGDTTTMDRTVPTPVSALAPANRIAAGTYHTCAVTAAGGVSCWGRNHEGQLGDTTQMDRRAPVQVSSLAAGVSELTLGTAHSCALLATGAVRCWGDNERGQLGDGTQQDRASPVDVVGLSSGVIALGAGDQHTCALLAIGEVRCWGDNYRGQLGGHLGAFSATPVAIAGVGSPTALAVGGHHVCALVNAGVKCWGYDNAGQLGNGVSSSTSSASPVDVVGLSGVARIGSGYSHVCATLVAGGAMCWGDNVRGELGDGTVVTRHAPVSVVGF
ncbi:MAG TPA: hypothetical protein VIV11_17025 [Kofleriaceae bacterium]